MLTGVREAVRALRMLKGASEEEANAAAGAVDGGLPSRKRKQVNAVAASQFPSSSITDATISQQTYLDLYTSCTLCCFPDPSHKAMHQAVT